MDFNHILTALDIDESTPLAEHWGQSESSFPAELPRFLEPEIISQTRDFGHLPAAADSELHEAARRIAVFPELLHLAWHCHLLLYEHLEYEPSKISRWPILTGPLGGLSGTFYLLIALEAIPRMLILHEKLGIPEKISRDTCSHYA